jgi:cold shock CspA family protein
MSSENDMEKETQPNLEIGCVKWFNNKAGYGFITITQGEKKDMDIFVHHKSIGINNNEYKYLVQGEYVEFNLNKVLDGKHEFQATNVVGSKNARLMCEIRHELKVARNNNRNASISMRDVNSNNQSDNNSLSRTEPRGEKSDWSLVKKDKMYKKKEKDTFNVTRGRPVSKLPV